MLLLSSAKPHDNRRTWAVVLGKLTVSDGLEVGWRRVESRMTPGSRISKWVVEKGTGWVLLSKNSGHLSVHKSGALRKDCNPTYKRECFTQEVSPEHQKDTRE